MQAFPEAFVKRMSVQLQDQADAFFRALQEEASVSIRLNPGKTNPSSSEKAGLPEGAVKIPWAERAYYLVKRPSFTFDPLFHAGHYYVQEASSMLIEEVFKQCVNREASLRVLDLCAAPGGKSTHLLSLLNSQSLLISNEVINARSVILAENILRWGNPNVVVTNNDPEHFSMFEGCFDIVLIDAPCSGEGMFRKDPDAIKEWSEQAVQACSSRQKRILKQAADLVAPDGLLIYSTCTFAPEENEDNILSLFANDEWESVKMDFPEAWGIQQQDREEIFSYRSYPHKVRGEGFFLSVFKKAESAYEGKWPRASKKIQALNPKFISPALPYLNQDWKLSFYLHRNQVLAFPGELCKEMLGLLNTSLHIKLFGTDIGNIIRDELIPSHSLALSLIRNNSLPRLSLCYDDAIAYLQKKDIHPDTRGYKSWTLVEYEGAALGWVKILPNRINNFYPKEWRIRKESDVQPSAVSAFQDKNEPSA